MASMERRCRRIASPSRASTGPRGDVRKTPTDSAMIRSLRDERQASAAGAKLVDETVFAWFEAVQHHKGGDARRENLFYVHAQVLELGGPPAFVFQHQF